MTVDRVQPSCGHAVPFMEFKADRDTLDKWTEDRGPDGVRACRAEENRETIDGLPSGIGV